MLPKTWALVDIDASVSYGLQLRLYFKKFGWVGTRLIRACLLVTDRPPKRSILFVSCMEYSLKLVSHFRNMPTQIYLWSFLTQQVAFLLGEQDVLTRKSLWDIDCGKYPLCCHRNRVTQCLSSTAFVVINSRRFLNFEATIFFTLLYGWERTPLSTY